jgi:hypothetical protein
VIKKLMLIQVWRLRAQHPQYRVLNRDRLNALLYQVLIGNTFLAWYTMSGMVDLHVTTLQAHVATNAEYANQWELGEIQYRPF